MRSQPQKASQRLKLCLSSFRNSSSTLRPSPTMASAKPEKLMWDSPDFAKMYASAEKMTGIFAKLLLEEVNMDKVSEDKEVVVLDEACGTGVVSALLMDMLSDKAKGNLTLVCADFADAMVEYVGRRIESCGWKNTRAVKADGMDTKLPSSHFTHIVLNFGPMIFPDWKAGVKEIHRMLRPGGVVAMSSWAKVGWIPDVREAFATDPEIPTMPADEDLRNVFSPGGRWDDPAWIREVVTAEGLQDVQTKCVPNTTSLSGVSEFVGLIAGTVGLITAKCWTKEQHEKYNGRAQAAVTEYMKQKYGDGEIRWDWIAILTTARKP